MPGINYASTSNLRCSPVWENFFGWGVMGSPKFGGNIFNEKKHFNRVAFLVKKIVN
jgi:hypothetical protein